MSCTLSQHPKRGIFWGWVPRIAPILVLGLFAALLVPRLTGRSCRVQFRETRYEGPFTKITGDRTLVYPGH
ncbi:hypothetical protein EKL30_00190 [Candidimonas sp. SYP-B2681]|uniref:hypothetical protein n=1 Tax=Candidimonas sp. SYP-B2681 TaxID=2497686 RepID=UPI000F882D85|nr:hypothetical protein [Candidimonas sp. SYP-B2681]RTZ47470.1 hypothetical protein EKL30_00190 [Candidimonas sp. SYP-B2681]